MLFVIDGSKALRKAVRLVFGNDVPVQRCVRHKERNVLDHLPERDRQAVKARLRQRVGRRPTTTVRSSSSTRSRSSSTTRTPAPPARCGRGWRRR